MHSEDLRSRRDALLVLEATPARPQALNEPGEGKTTASELMNVKLDPAGSPGSSSAEGARLRLRPILMTSFAFIFGCLPLWFASGAGAVARRVLGPTVIGGMLATSGIAIFLIPVTFYIMERLFSGRKAAPAQKIAERPLDSAVPV